MPRKTLRYKSSKALAKKMPVTTADKASVFTPVEEITSAVEQTNTSIPVQKSTLTPEKTLASVSTKKSSGMEGKPSVRLASSKSLGRHSASRQWVLSGLLALALSLLVGTQVYAQVQQANDTMAIKQVVLTSIGAPLQAVVVPHSQRVSALVASPRLALAASSADLLVAQTQARTLFTGVYDTKCVPCQTAANKTYQTLQGESKGTYRALAWAVRDVVWKQVFLNGQTASITVSATLWSEVQYVDEFGKLNTVTPTGGTVMIYTLAKTGSTWLITNQVPDDTAASNLPVSQQKPNGTSGPPPAGQPTPVKTDEKVIK